MALNSHGSNGWLYSASSSSSRHPFCSSYSGAAAFPLLKVTLAGYFVMQLNPLCTISRGEEQNSRALFRNQLLLPYMLPSTVTKTLHTTSFHSRSYIQQAFADYITFTNLRFLSSPRSSMHLRIKFL